MNRTIGFLKGGERLKLLQGIREHVLSTGQECTLFTANRTLNHLWGAYVKGVEEDPTIKAAVLDGKFTFERKN